MRDSTQRNFIKIHQLSITDSPRLYLIQLTFHSAKCVAVSVGFVGKLRSPRFWETQEISRNKSEECKDNAAKHATNATATIEIKITIPSLNSQKKKKKKKKTLPESRVKEVSRLVYFLPDSASPVFINFPRRAIKKLSTIKKPSRVVLSIQLGVERAAGIRSTLFLTANINKTVR